MSTSTLFPTLRDEIAGIPIADLVQRFGTPTYVYDLNTIYEKIDSLRAFDVIRYAQKACNNIAILDRMRRKGVLVDAVTSGEVQRAIKAGFSPHGDPAPSFTLRTYSIAEGPKSLRVWGSMSIVVPPT